MFKRLLVGALCLGLSWGASAEKLETGNGRLDRISMDEAIEIGNYLYSELWQETTMLSVLNYSCEELNTLWVGNEGYTPVWKALALGLLEFSDDNLEDEEVAAATVLGKSFHESRDGLAEKDETGGLKEVISKSREAKTRLLSREVDSLIYSGFNHRQAVNSLCTEETEEIISSIEAKIRRSKDKCEPCKKLFD